MKNNTQNTGYAWFNNYDRGVPYHIDYPRLCVHQLFDSATAIDPSRICLVFGDQKITYGEVQAFSNMYARNLVSLGVKPGDRVGLALPNCPKFVIAFLAILRTGAIVTAMNPMSTAQEIHFQVEDAGVKFIVGDILNQAVLTEAIKNAMPRLLILEDSLHTHGYFARVLEINPTTGFNEIWTDELESIKLIDLPIIQPESPAIFQYSGGTTGVPKAAIGSHRGIVANILQFSVWLTSLEEGCETWLSAIPFYHVYGMVIGLFVGIHKRATLVLLPDARDVKAVIKAAINHRVTFLPGVPALFSAIIRYLDSTGGMDQSFCIKVCISGSASLHEKIKFRFEELTGSRILEGYGLSEAPTATHCNPLQGENRIGSIGLPLPDVSCKLMDIETGSFEVSPGEAGELLIQGPQVMLGYHNHFDEDQMALKNGWFFTGDVARMDSDGYFYLIDRKKDLIKVGGFQVWPKEVETELMLHPSVSEAAVVGIINQENSQEIVHAWVVLKPGMRPSDGDLKIWCSRNLSRYKIPRVFHFVEGLPKSSVGKVLRRELQTTVF